MKKIDLGINRDGAHLWFENIKDNIYELKTDKQFVLEYCRIGSDDAEIYMVDPSGGPYISIGEVFGDYVLDNIFYEGRCLRFELNKKKMNKFFGELIVKDNKSGETPYKLNLYNSKSIRTLPVHKGSISYYRYRITVNGNEKEHFNYVYVIYYYTDPGGFLIPHCCFTDENEADNFIKYWNDDNGILATGHYYLKKKVEVV